MIKIAWLCPYPIDKLLPQIKLLNVNLKYKGTWIYNLEQALKNEEIQFHIITHSSNVAFFQIINKGNRTFYIIDNHFPFFKKGFPDFLPLNRIFRFPNLLKKYSNVLNTINPDLIHSFGTEEAYSYIASKVRYTSLISMQGIIAEIYKISRRFSHRVQISIEKNTIINNKYFDCRTNFDRDFVLQYNPNAHVFYIPRAINTIFFNTNWEGISSNSIIFVGSVTKAKGILVLLRAFYLFYSQHNNVRLKIIGTGANIKEELKSKSYYQKIKSNVDWLGSCSPQGIADELSKARIYVLSSLIENSPNSLAEAMAVGIPCIASNVGGVSSMLNDGKDGFLFDPGDSEDLAQKFSLLFSDIELCKRISINAKKLAIERNMPKNVMQKVLNVYNLILAEKNI